MDHELPQEPFMLELLPLTELVSIVSLDLLILAEVASAISVL